MCETDYSGYPDCRDDTLKSLQSTINLGMDTRFVVHTPLMWIDKADTWALASELGGESLVALIREETHSCYLGDRREIHDWVMVAVTARRASSDPGLSTILAQAQPRGTGQLMKSRVGRRYSVKESTTPCKAKGLTRGVPAYSADCRL